RKEQVRVRLCKPDIIACHDGDAMTQLQQFQGVSGILQSSTGGDGMANLPVRKGIEQFLRAREDAQRRRLLGIDTGMDLLNALGFLLRDRPPGLPQEGIEHEPSAHADLTVNPPDWQLNAGCLGRFTPREDVLVHTVNEGPVQIEQERHGLRPLVVRRLTLRAWHASQCSYSAVSRSDSRSSRPAWLCPTRLDPP